MARQKLMPDKKTLDMIFRLAQVQATNVEIAGMLQVSPKCWAKFRDTYPEVKETIEQGKVAGLVGLRRMQFEQAQKNPTMAIFLGKQLLGQRDVQYVKNEYDDLTEEELDSLLLEHAKERGYELTEAPVGGQIAEATGSDKAEET